MPRMREKSLDSILETVSSPEKPIPQDYTKNELRFRPNRLPKRTGLPETAEQPVAAKRRRMPPQKPPRKNLETRKALHPEAERRMRKNPKSHSCWLPKVFRERIALRLALPAPTQWTKDCINAPSDRASIPLRACSDRSSGTQLTSPASSACS